MRFPPRVIVDELPQPISEPQVVDFRVGHRPHECTNQNGVGVIGINKSAGIAQQRGVLTAVRQKVLVPAGPRRLKLIGFVPQRVLEFRVGHVQVDL